MKDTITVGRYTLEKHRSGGYTLLHFDMNKNIDYEGRVNDAGDLIEYYYRLKTQDEIENVPVEASPYTRMLAHELKNRLELL